METGEPLLKLIIGKDAAECTQYNKVEASQYLHHLNSCGLNKLCKELDRIAEERASVVNQTQELAFQNYPTFIETAQCAKEINEDFQKINSHTDKLLFNISLLHEKCNEFSHTAQSLSGARRLTSLALSRHTQLLEILELPQLMETCVRNGYWEEALELSGYVARLERKLGYISLITKIAHDVQSCTRLMLSQLIAQLRMPAQLPHCLKVIGYLRRMGVFSEEELRLKFLQARDSWFRSTLEEVPKEDAYHHILKIIELNRVHLFDIATQYRAIFSDEDLLVLANRDPTINELAIFHSWITQKVTNFLTTLQADLVKISSSSLESVFGQCMYFGLSFGRIGSDFRPLLVPMFSQIVFDRFEQSINKSEVQFATSMANLTFNRTNTTISTSVATSSADQIQPPYPLMEFQPLAELCNGIIYSFNELRLCAPIHLISSVTRKLQQALQNCSQVLSDFHRHENEAFHPNEQQQFQRCLQLYSKDLLDFVQKIIHLIFPSTHIGQQTGLSSSEVQKHDIGSLNRVEIIKPIENLLVRKESEDLHSLSSHNLAIESEAESVTTNTVYQTEVESNSAIGSNKEIMAATLLNGEPENESMVQTEVLAIDFSKSGSEEMAKDLKEKSVDLAEHAEATMNTFPSPSDSSDVTNNVMEQTIEPKSDPDTQN